jgi:tetratricopeptide (TPR) repeat protein
MTAERESFQLKPLQASAIPGALQKAERYRLLNEPWQAESICQDILAVDPNHQQALITLLLALTDQFGRGLEGRVRESQDILARISGEYEKAYYAGIIAERQGNFQLRKRVPGSGYGAYDLLRQAMQHYERAERLSPSGNESAVLRWNTCARRLMRNPSLQPRDEEGYEPALGE